MRGTPIDLIIINKFVVTAQKEVEYSKCLTFEGITNIRKGVVHDRGRDAVSSAGALSKSSLTLTMPLLPNYIPADKWIALKNKDGFFTLRQDDAIILEDIRWTIRGIADNTKAPKGKHFVIEAVDDLSEPWDDDEGVGYGI